MSEILTNAPDLTQFSLKPDPTNVSEVKDIFDTTVHYALQKTVPSTDLFGGPQLKQLDPNMFEAMQSGFTQFGVTTGLYNAITEEESANNYIDPEFDLPTYIQSDPGLSNIVKEALKNEHTDPGFKSLIEDLESEGSNNSESALDHIMRQKRV